MRCNWVNEVQLGKRSQLGKRRQLGKRGELDPKIRQKVHILHIFSNEMEMMDHPTLPYPPQSLDGEGACYLYHFTIFTFLSGILDKYDVVCFTSILLFPSSSSSSSSSYPGV